MAVGVDVGTQFCVSARRGPNQCPAYRLERNIYLRLPLDEVGEMMTGTDMGIRDGNNFLLFGEKALQMASVRRMEVERPLCQGIINASNVDGAYPMLAAILKHIITPPTDVGEVLAYTVPSQPVDSPQTKVSFHEDVVRSMFDGPEAPLKDSWTLAFIREASALAYATLEKHGYTGVAVSFGAGMANACLLYQGQRIFDFAIARGGDWIDMTAAQSVGDEASYIIQVKEQNEYDINGRGSNGQHMAIVSAYNAYLNYWTHYFKTIFVENTKRLVRLNNLPVVVAGGTSMAPGFIPALKARLADMPIQFTSIEAADDPLHAVARGAYRYAANKQLDLGIGDPAKV